MAKILIVDDSPVEIKIIRRFLGDRYEITEALDGQTALKLAHEIRPDLILLDIIMPGMDGLSVCKKLKSQKPMADIPVIFITAVADSREVVRGFEAGGQDYITKPFFSPELCARIKVHLELKKSKEILLEYARELELKNRELGQVMEKFRLAAMTDYMTGLANRRSMIQQIKSAVDNLEQNTGKAAIILADIDDFKQVNDTYGHDCGDLVIKEVAALIKSVVREDTAVARWGGEEFLLLLTDAGLKDGQIIAERIRTVIETAPFYCRGEKISVTVTLGVAEITQATGLDASIKNADQALYKGKLQSKNCVVSYLAM
ncbi:MAG: diguanylate cyclase [Veillonellales bacterium]